MSAVDDVGNIVHEVIVDGQTHGGIAQGLGQVLGEHVRYSDDGQLLNATFMDYRMPRADDVPELRTAHHSVPCTTNPLGVKGAGESGVAGSLPSGHECRHRRARVARYRSLRSAGLAGSYLGSARAGCARQVDGRAP